MKAIIVIEGSGIGPAAPAAYIVTAADLHPITTGNCIGLFEFADDTCLVVPAINSGLHLDEISHIEAWAMQRQQFAA